LIIASISMSRNSQLRTNEPPNGGDGKVHMHHKLTVFAVTVAATLGTLAMGLAGTAAADGIYQVYGTGGYGLNVHTGPGEGAPNVGNLPEATNVDVARQLYGDSVTDPVTGVTSSVWDELGGATRPRTSPTCT
jgi:hypothetical protein